MSYELSFVESVSAIGPERWSELQGPDEFPFLRFAWLSALETSGCVAQQRGWIPRHIVIRRAAKAGEGELIAVCPTYLKFHSMGEFVFDQNWAEFSEVKLGVPYYPKLILAVPFTPASGPRILFQKGVDQADVGAVYDLLTGALPDLSRKMGLSSIHILFPDQAQTEQFKVRGWAERLGVQYQFKNNGCADFNDFLGEFRSKTRAMIRREVAHLQKSDVTVRAYTGAQLTPEHAKVAHALYLTTVDKYVWGKRYLSASFFESVLSTMPDAVHLVLAERGPGQVIGGAFNLLGAEALYGRYWGAFEEEPFLHFNVCLYEGVRETIARGLLRFEPGAGGEHKRGRGFVPTLTSSLHHLEDQTLDRAVRDFVAREADAIRAHVDGSG